MRCHAHSPLIIKSCVPPESALNLKDVRAVRGKKFALMKTVSKETVYPGEGQIDSRSRRLFLLHLRAFLPNSSAFLLDPFKNRSSIRYGIRYAANVKRQLFHKKYEERRLSHANGIFCGGPGLQRQTTFWRYSAPLPRCKEFRAKSSIG